MFYIQSKHNSQVFLAVKVPPVEVAVEAGKENSTMSKEAFSVEIKLYLVLALIQ